MSAGQSDLCDGRLSGGGGLGELSLGRLPRPSELMLFFFLLLRQQASLEVGPNRLCSLRECNNLPFVPEKFLGHREGSHLIM